MNGPVTQLYPTNRLPHMHARLRRWASQSTSLQTLSAHTSSPLNGTNTRTLSTATTTPTPARFQACFTSAARCKDAQGDGEEHSGIEN